MIWLNSSLVSHVATVRWWLGLESSLRLPHIAGGWSWLSARSSVGPVGWKHLHMASPCDLGFFRAQWLGSKNEHPKRTMRKLYWFFMTYPWKSNNITSAVLQEYEIQAGGTSIPHLDERRDQHHIVRWGMGDLILEIIICHSHQCTWDVSEEG